LEVLADNFSNIHIAITGFDPVTQYRRYV
jgi:hypothetical protein